MIGVDPVSGKFRTAGSECYPSALNKFLADRMVQSFLAAPPPGVPTRPPDGWRGVCGIDACGRPVRQLSAPRADVWPLSEDQPILTERTRVSNAR
eukprot:6741620-Heterocapsa_arctica.AAC.1